MGMRSNRGYPGHNKPGLPHRRDSEILNPGTSTYVAFVPDEPDQQFADCESKSHRG